MTSTEENAVLTQETGALPGHHPWLFCFAVLVCFATVQLILIGGEVKSHEAGLSVPDWPTTYGENMFTYPFAKWKSGPVFYEHFHRLVASGIGLLTIILTVWVWLKDSRRWMKVLAGLTLLTVVAQGVLGGLTVLMALPWWVSSAHGILAQTFLLMLVLLAYGASEERARRCVEGGETRTGLVTAAAALIAIIFVQLFLGAVVRHTESGLAIPDFPSAGGSIVPRLNAEGAAWVNTWRAAHVAENPQALIGGDITVSQMHIHFSHRVGAVLVLIAVFAATKSAARHRAAFPMAFKTMHLVGGLLLLQIFLGASIIWTARTPIITSLHVVTGALLLAAAFLVLLRAWPVRPIPPETDAGAA